MRNIYIFLTLMISFVSHSWGQGNTCATATTLTAAATCTYTAGTTVGATYQSNAANGGVPSCASPGAPDVFYVFTTTVAGNYTFDSNTGTITDGGMAIYSGACGSLTQVACDDDSSPNGAMPMITASLAAGTTYYIRFWAYGGINTGTFSICITSPSPPATNDNCATATVLTQEAAGSCTATAGTVGGATNSGIANCTGTADDDVWYSFVATSANVIIRRVTTGGWDSGVELFDSTGVAPGSCIGTSIGCQDAENDYNAGGLTIGRRYYVRVYSWGSGVTPSPPTFTICISTPPPPPANDNCASAIVLTQTAFGSCVPTAGTVAAALSSGIANCTGTADDDVWYSFIAVTSTAIITRATTGSWDSGVEIFAGTGIAPGTCIGASLGCQDAETDFTVTGLTVGNRYFVRMYSWSSGFTPATPTFTICVTSPPPPPANDNCAGAVNLTQGAIGTCTTTAGTVAGATASGGSNCIGTADDDVWYSFVATSSAAIIRRITTGSWDSGVEIFNSVGAAPGTCLGTSLGCQDAETDFIVGGLTVGTRYYVRIYTYSSGFTPATPGFTICITTPPPPPANDNPCSATALTVNTSCLFTGSTTASATGTVGVPAPGCSFYSGGDVWFTAVVPASGRLIIDCNTGVVLDGGMAIYIGTCSALTLLECDDDASANGAMPYIDRSGLTPGTTVWIRFWEYGNDNNGTFSICASSPTPVVTNLSACSGNFFDTGGNGTVYGNNETRITTICPSIAGNKVSINFTAFATENSVDFLTIYDGNSTAAPSLGFYSGTSSPGIVTATPSNASGCLTFVFTSDAVTTDAGWASTISCFVPCQTINAVLNSTSPAALGGIIRVCQGSSVNFVGSGTFSNSPVGATYQWNMGNGVTVNGANINYTYPAPGSYLVNLVIADPNGCRNNNVFNQIVQVSTTPVIATSATPASICLGQTSALAANVTMTPFVTNCTPPVSGTTFLPDGSGVSYTTSIPINCYSATQTITAGTDIQNICLNMEHSYLGDLNIRIICPNGQSMVLKPYTGTGGGGGGTYLGNANDDGTLTAGTGMTYCFTPGATTFLVNGSTVPAGSNPVGVAIAPGNYLPTDPFTNLIGCPANGNWTIEVTDNLAIDNGYIFNWDVNLAGSVAPAPSFTPTIASQGWQAATGLTTLTSTTANVTPTAVGSPCYVYSVTDNFGCTYTQNQCVTVTSSNTIAPGVNRTTCVNTAMTAITLATTGATGATFTGLPAGVTGSWAGNVATISGTPTAGGTFNYTVTLTGGCGASTATGTITVITVNTVAAGINRTTCINSAITSITLATTGATGATVTGLPAGVTGTWAANVVTISGTPTASGSFTYTVTTTGGCPPATTTGTITVNQNTIAAGTSQTVCINISINPINLATTGATGATFAGLPAGVTGSWAGNVATISGTPTASGTFNYTITTTGGCPPATTTGTITVNQNTIAAGTSQTVCRLSPIATISLATTGATGASYTNIPPGLSASWAGNVVTVSGTPNTAGTYNYTITTTGGCPPATATGTIIVNPLHTITAGADRTVCQNSAMTNITMTLGSGATGATVVGLPTGLIMGVVGTTVTISGTPTTAGTFNYTVTTTGSACTPVTATGTITVSPIYTVAAGINRTTCINTAITAITLATTGATGATLTGLPAGVTGTWAANVVTISGTPTVSGTFNYTVTTTGGCPPATATGTITVNSQSVAPVAITGTNTICASSSTTLSVSGGSLGTGAVFNWYSGSCGGTLVGTGNSITVSPAANTTYFVRAEGSCNTTTCASTVVTVNTASTAPTIVGVPGTVCPNTNITLTASGGTVGTGSDIFWYSGANGSGTPLGTGASIVITPSSTMTVYARRQGTCNNSVDAVTTVTVKTYIYAANGTSTTTYCTDNAGWHHFYVGNDIILSVLGNLGTAGTVTATIRDNNAYYQDPGNTMTCTGEVQFEMERNWNISYTGTLSGPYDIRYYFQPAERTAVITAANNWITTYASCSYTYKYPNPSGWFWFKNQGSAYSAPDYDDDATFLMLTSGGTGTTTNGINYATMTGVPNFSGGTGGVILIPTTLLPLEWLYFTGHTEERINKLEWATAKEENTAYFEITRSRDGVNFETIGSVDAMGNSTENSYYGYNDLNPFTGLNYYRLRLFNTDGTTELSDIVVLEIKDDGKNFGFYPNPVTDEIFYQFSADFSEDIQIEIIDVLGRILRTNILKSVAGTNNLRTDMKDLVPGTYNIRVTHIKSGKISSAKIVKK